MRDDARVARRVARALLAIALSGPVVLAFLWIAAPAGHSPMFSDGPIVFGFIPLAKTPPVVGVNTYLVGLAWMIRIYRSHLEPEPSGWRYRP